MILKNGGRIIRNNVDYKFELREPPNSEIALVKIRYKLFFTNEIQWQIQNDFRK